MAYIQTYKDQNWLLPPSLEDLIPEDHLCFLVESLVDSLDYSYFDFKYSGAGHPAYHPRVLVKLLVMGVLDRVRSSRRLAKNARENVVYMYLGEKVAPDFRTLSDFRKNHPDFLKEVFRHTVGFAKQEGLLDLSHLSTDGSKVKANASNKRVLTEEELEVLLRFVEGELEEWAKRDGIEDEEFGELRGFDQLPHQSKKTIRKAAQYYMKKAQEKGSDFTQRVGTSLRKAKEENLKKVSVTDPDSRFMKNKKGRIELSYNPQVTVDGKGFILANDVCQSAHDAGQLKPQVIQTEENLGAIPEKIKWSFDSGYFESGNIGFLAGQDIDGYIPEHNKKKACNPYDKQHFIYDSAKDEYACPRNRKMVFVREQWDNQKEKVIRVYKGTECSGCQAQWECTKSKAGVRYLKIFPYEAERNGMIAKMKTPQAKDIYRIRGQTVEPVIGDIKENKGLRAFLTRGIESVRSEFNIICAARNIKRIWNHFQAPKRLIARETYCIFGKFTITGNTLLFKERFL